MSSNTEKQSVESDVQQILNCGNLIDDKHCRVCGAKAIINLLEKSKFLLYHLGFNYNGLSCESCKTFFRRNAFKPPNIFQCFNKNSCKINQHNRTHCKKCRLDACFAIGMKKEFIWKTKYSAKSKFFSKEKYNYQITLTSDLRMIQQVRPLILTSHELSHLKEIERAMQNIPEESSLETMGTVKSMDQFYSFPQLYITMFIRFCKSLSTFRMLKEEDQLKLVKRAYVETLNVRFAFGLDPGTNSFPMLANEDGTKAITMSNDLLFELKRSELPIRFMKFQSSIHALMERDVTIRNLIIVHFLFANRDETLLSPELIHYQFIFYCTLLLRYYEHKYGCAALARQKYYTLMQALKGMDYQVEKIKEFYERDEELTKRDPVHKEIFDL